MHRNENATASQAGHLCPACHDPVTEKITRHHTMGLVVPLWKPGPCRNPSCPEYVPRDGLSRSEREELAALRRENRQLREEISILTRGAPTGVAKRP